MMPIPRPRVRRSHSISHQWFGRLAGPAALVVARTLVLGDGTTKAATGEINTIACTLGVSGASGDGSASSPLNSLKGFFGW